MVIKCKICFHGNKKWQCIYGFISPPNNSNTCFEQSSMVYTCCDMNISLISKDCKTIFSWKPLDSYMYHKFDPATTSYFITSMLFSSNKFVVAIHILLFPNNTELKINHLAWKFVVKRKKTLSWQHDINIQIWFLDSASSRPNMISTYKYDFWILHPVGHRNSWIVVYILCLLR